MFIRVVNGSFFLFRMDEVRCSAVSQRRLSISERHLLLAAWPLNSADANTAALEEVASVSSYSMSFAIVIICLDHAGIVLERSGKTNVTPSTFSRSSESLFRLSIVIEREPYAYSSRHEHLFSVGFSTLLYLQVVDNGQFRRRSVRLSVV